MKEPQKIIALLLTPNNLQKHREGVHAKNKGFLADGGVQIKDEK